MSRFFSFTAGAMCGALLGAAAVLLLTPSSGSDLLASARGHWENALAEGRKAMEARQKELEAQFDQMKRA